MDLNQTHKAIFDVIRTLAAGQHVLTASIANGTFRGIINALPGYWNIVAMTPEAKLVMEGHNWTGNYTKGLVRDHILSGKEFQDFCLQKHLTFEQWQAALKDFGKVVICTKAQNPSRGPGYNVTYKEADLIWLKENNPLDISLSIPKAKRTWTRWFQEAEVK